MDIITALLELENIVSILTDLYTKITDGLMSYLPNSPFQSLLQNMNALPYLPVLNWFFPISEIAYVTVNR